MTTPTEDARAALSEYEEDNWGFNADEIAGKLAAALRALIEPPTAEPCEFCGWTGPRTQYLGVERIAVAHPDGSHEKDWLPALRRQVSHPEPEEWEYSLGVDSSGQRYRRRPNQIVVRRPGPWLPVPEEEKP